MDCFAEPVLGPAYGGTRGLAMTGDELITLYIAASAQAYKM